MSCLLSPAKEWLDRTSGTSERSLSSLEDWQPGDRIDRYQLDEQIGEGGFGVVYRAIQVEPIHREVALKILKAGMASRDVVARFEGERQALAMMDHPNIARVYDAGSTFAGTPYFVMEMVKGRPITQFTRNLPLEDRLRLFIQACRGVQHAHQKGIIHRDIKPSNVLVVWEGIISVAKVIDFGIAKALEQPLADKTIYTAYGQVMGTLQYMSPEQAVSAGVDVDTRSDVYSLGVLLYEILTGVTPLPEELLIRNDMAEILKAIRDLVPLRPSVQFEKNLRITKVQSIPATVIPAIDWEDEVLVSSATLRGDLDWIVMKALEKERARRYASVSALMEDIEHFLKGEPVQARAPTARYRVARFAKRNTILLRFVAALTVVLALATLVTGWLALRAIRAEGDTRNALEAEAAARQEASEQARETRKQLVRLSVVTGDEMVEDGDPYGALLWYAEALRIDQGDEDNENLHRRRYTGALYSGPALMQMWPDVAAAAFSPDSHRVLLTSRDGNCQVWSCETRQPVSPRWTEGAGLNLARIAGGSSLCAGITRDGKLGWWDTTDVSRKGPLLPLSASKSPVGDLWDWSADGRWMVVALANGLQVYDATQGKPVGPLLMPGEGGTTATKQVRLSGDGRRVASCGEGPRVQVWDTATGHLVWQRETESEAVVRLALSSDGSRLATVSGPGGNMLDIWDLPGEARLWPSFRPGGAIHDLDFSPDGRRIAVASHDSYARVFDVASGLPLTESMRHPGAVREVHFNQDGTRLATSGVGETSVRLWNAATGTALTPWISHPSALGRSCLSPDGEWLLTSGDDGGMRLWHVPLDGARQRLNHGARLALATFLPQDKMALTLGSDGAAVVWEVAGGRALVQFRLPFAPVVHDVSKDGRWLVAGSAEGQVQAWDLETGKPVTPLLRHGATRLVQVKFTPGADSFCALGLNGVLRFWDRATGGLLDLQLEGAREDIHQLGFASDGKTLLASHGKNLLSVWSARGGNVLKDAMHPAEDVRKILFGNDEKGLPVVVSLSGGPQGAAQIWKADSLLPLGERLPHSRPFDVDLSPDGKYAVTGGGDNTARIWETTAGKRVGRSLTHFGYVFRVKFSPDSRLVATCSDDGTARVWDTESGEPVSPPLPQGAAALSWSSDSRQLLTASAKGLVAIWDVSPVGGTLAELKIQAELLASRRIDALLGTAQLSGHELAARWQQLGGQLPQTASPAPRLKVSRR
ncbi:MAG TPA: WD40 repeat domain-containing serine/threonine protein kinase [Verrucomicrobium sp.]|nr:WD40 repeat domain-containing serine/threonine protein kinase [Verrucomicrobium sp.]